MGRCPTCARGELYIMSTKVVFGVILVSLALCSAGFGFEPPDSMLGVNGCDEPACCEEVCREQTCRQTGCESRRGQGCLSIGVNSFVKNEYWNWFEGPSPDSEYDYGYQRTRLNFKYTTPRWTGFVQPQLVNMFGLPDNACKPPPEGPSGMGCLYYNHNGNTAPWNIGVHQAYIDVHGTDKKGFSFKFGRLEYSDGLEVLRKSDGKHFNMLKKIRLGDRLISPFGWSAFSRAFDGTVMQYDQENTNVTASFFFPTQGGWERNIDQTIDDIRISTVTVTSKRGSYIPGMEVAGFYYNYQDLRDVTQRVDNTGQTYAPSVDMNIHMFGGHAVGTWDIGPGTMDLLLWGGGQFGKWYELYHNAYAFDVEGGYQFTNMPAKPWVRVGYYIGTGDGDPNDGKHGTFFQMAPGTRKYNLLPFCDLMNVEDFFIQLIAQPRKKLTTRLEYHVWRLENANDRWYMGSGPTQKHGKIFGYIGRPSSGRSNLAQELDFMVNYNVNPHLKAIACYSRVFGEGVVKGVYTKDGNADYASAKIVFEF